MAEQPSHVIDSTCDKKECEGRESYTVPVYCLNCEWRGEIRWTLGHHSYYIGEKCPELQRN